MKINEYEYIMKKSELKSIIDSKIGSGIKNVLTHKISYTYAELEEDKQLLHKRIEEYLDHSFISEGLVKDFELYKEMDDETFTPYILVVMFLNIK